jgi:hypothetical protein
MTSTTDGTSLGGSSSSSSILDNVPNAENMKDGNKWHRVIKHRDINDLNKYVMGLETYHNYYFRYTCDCIHAWLRSCSYSCSCIWYTDALLSLLYIT